MLLITGVRYCTECTSIPGSVIAVNAPQYWGSDTALNAAYIPNANQKLHQKYGDTLINEGDKAGGEDRETGKLN